jgi:uncharacterized membrane protein
VGPLHYLPLSASSFSILALVLVVAFALIQLDVIPELGAPIASIGGAGTFYGIFLVGIVAVLLASLPGSLRPKPTTA